MNMTKTIVAMTAVLVAAVVQAGDSAPFLLDTAEGTRIAHEVETIAYSTAWNNGDAVRVAADGVTLKEAVAPASGDVVWNAANAGVGGHALTHTSGGETLRAQFAVLGDDVAVHAGTLGTMETWGTNKVHLITAAVTVPSGVSLIIERGAVVKFMPGTSLTVASGGSCTARGVIFTHVNDDTIGGDTLLDGGNAVAKMGDYAITGNITDDDSTEYRYMPPLILTSNISSNTRLRGYRTYIASNSVTVASGVTLTLQPGTIIKFASGCSLTVNGTLDAQGTRAAPIVFTSLKDDEHGGDTNGDGDKTYAQAGDWKKIAVYGTATFDNARLYYASSGSGTEDAILVSGGTVRFNNSEMAFGQSYAVGVESGHFYAENAIIREYYCAFRHWPYDPIVNSIIYNCNRLSNNNGQKLYNCIIVGVNEAWDWSSGSGNTYSHCVFWNEPGFGLQSLPGSALTSNGNIWGNPLFVDPDNGDFRIAANSPCVDAGDGTVAPETDYWGQPRMDVKRVKDTGKPNGDGVCPDIGIYEVPGAAAVPLPDLAVVSVGISSTGGSPVPGGNGNAPAARCTVGDTITLTYTVTNRGTAAATGLVRDLFRFKGADASLGGLTVDAAEVEQAYSVPTGACITLTASVTVPALKAGEWKVGLVVNAERDVYENVMANNASEAEGTISIALDSFVAGGSTTVEIVSGGVAGAAATGLPASGGAIVATLPRGVSFYASVGYVPDAARHDVVGSALSDGRTALFIPTHDEGETVYVTLVNDSGTAQTVTLEALASSDGLEVAKPADVAVTAKGPNVTAKLVLPESVRDGRIYAAWVEYSNSGDQDVELPIFTISRTGGGATFSAAAKGEYSANPLSLIGLAPTAPRGKLKPGEAGRVPFYVLSSGSLSVKLGMVTEKSTSALNGFSSIAEYRAGMSAAATRLCARGGVDPDFTAVLAQALNEKRGAGGAALCGTLRHEVTGEPLAGYQVALVSTNDNAVAAAATTDVNGTFVLATSMGGDYTVEVTGAQSCNSSVWSLVDADTTGVRLAAIPFGSVSGVVLAGGAAEVVADAYVTLDDLGTDVQEDYKSTSDESGQFRFEGLVDGIYELRIYPKDGWCMVSSGAFSVSNGVALAQNMVYETRGATVRGTLSDVDTGRAVTNAVVALEIDGMEDALAATPDAEGTWVLEGVPAGRYQVEVTGSGWETAAPLEVDVVGDAAQIDVKARPQAVFAPKRPVGLVPLETGFHIVRDIADPAWDFDGDGTVDSTEAFPTFTYVTAGTYAATLSYTDAEGVRRTCTHDVEAIEAFENVVSANGMVLTEGGAVQPVVVATNRLVVTGAAASSWPAGTVVGMEKGPLGGFVLRLLSAAVSDGAGHYAFEAEPATLGDLFDEYWAESEFAFTEEDMRRAAAASPMRLMASDYESTTETKDYPFSISFEKKPVTVTIGGVGTALKHTSDPVAGSQICYKRKGKEVSVVQTRNAYTFTLPITVEAGGSLGEGNIWKKAGIEGVWNGPGTWGPWGLYFSLDVDYGLDFAFKASGTFTAQTVLSMETVDETTTIGRKIKHKTLNRSFDKPKFEAKSLTGKLSAELDLYCVVGVYASWLKSIGRVGGGLRFGVVAGLSQELGIDFTSISEFLEDHIDTSMKLYTSIYATMQVSAKLLRKNETPKTKADWGDLGSTKNRARLFQSKLSADLPWKITYDSEVSIGKLGFAARGDGLDVTFAGKDPELEGTGFPLGLLDGISVETHGHVWSFGDGGFGSGATTSHTFAEKGEYTVALAAWCDLPSNLFQSVLPFPKVKRQRVKVFDDKPPEPQETKDTKTKNPSKSCDPNEMDGPDGVGEERYVKPGDWMTYTVYFENKSDADVPAQEVRVTNPLSQWLDWSSFEMREISFCNQVETGLAGEQRKTITVDQDDTSYKVQATVALDELNGSVEWYLRSIDPARAEFNYWPADGEGLLPPNDETHRGEGHITYRIKVREDAPANVVITNSASIVFDTNDPVETDPAWWNTVGSLGAAFVESEVEVGEGGTAEIRVNGGCEEKASSVKVYLTYNTAAAADVDLKNARAARSTSSTGGSPVQDGNAQAARSTGLKFPLTLTWEAGEIGEKVITIPIKTDKTVEDDEFFTLQLADAEGMELGEDRVCTVTIRDLNEKTLKAAVTAYKPKKDESVATNSVGVSVATSATLPSGTVGGFVAGTGEYTSGSKLTLTAEARPGWAFVGWRLSSTGGSPVQDGDILSNKAKWQIVVTNDEEYVAVFEKIPYVRGLADPADGGKVSGSGLCAVGRKVTLKATASKNFTFLGWRQGTGNGEWGTGNGFVATTATLVVDRSAKPAKNTKTSTTITNLIGDVTYFAVFKSDPKVTVAVEATDGKGDALTGKGAGKYVAGTITGTGKYAPGKKVTLKAAANKGYVFAGWYDGDENAQAARSTSSTGGSPVQDGNALAARSPSVSFTMPSNDVAYVAKFVTAQEDKDSITAYVDGWELEPWVPKTETHAFATNIWAGVYLEWPVAATALSEATVKVAGLPAGLKFAAKPVTSKVGSGKTAVVVTNVPANTIYGAPTAASKTKTNKNTGAVTVTPSAVKVTVTTAGKSSQTYQIDTVVEALPAWAVGTFAGGAFSSTGGSPVQGGDENAQAARSTSGVVSLTVSSAGKVSGKLLEDGLTWTLSAPYFSDVECPESDVDDPVFHATVIGKSGKAEITNDVTVVVEEAAGARDARPYRRGVVNALAARSTGSTGGSPVQMEWVAWQYNWKVEPWKTLGKSFDKTTMAYAILADGSFIDGDEALTSALGEEVTGRVTLKFAASGSVTVSGEFAAYDEKKEKYTTVKASGSATLVPADGDHGLAFVYLTPKGLPPHARCLDVPWPEE